MHLCTLHYLPLSQISKLKLHVYMSRSQHGAQVRPLGIRESPKIGSIFLGVPIETSKGFWGLSWVPPNLGNCHTQRLWEHSGVFMWNCTRDPLRNLHTTNTTSQNLDSKWQGSRVCQKSLGDGHMCIGFHHHCHSIS